MLSVCSPQRKKGRKKDAQFNRIGPLKTVTSIESVEREREGEERESEGERKRERERGRDSRFDRICGGQTEDLEKW